MEKIAVVSQDGVASKITVFRAESPDAPVIIVKPAMGVNARHYAILAQALVGQGFNVVTADLRGNGESGIRPGPGLDFGYHELAACDWPAEVNLVKDLFPRSPRILLGHSLGGQMSAMYMSAHPGEIQALVTVACPLVYYRLWPFPHNLKVLLMTQFFWLLAAVLGYFPGRRVGFGETEPKTYMKDWAYTTRTGMYRPLNSTTDYEALLPKLSAPVLAISMSDDGYAPKKAVLGLCAKMSRASVTHRHLVPRELGLQTLGHFHWLQNPEPVVSRVSDWLSQLFPPDR